MRENNSVLKKTIKVLKEHLVKYLKNHYNSYGISLSDEIILQLDPYLDSIIQDQIKHSFLKKLMANIDNFSLGKINLQSILGLDNTLNIIRKVRETSYQFISHNEPKELLMSFTDDKNKFMVLINFCFGNFILNILNRKFRFYEKLNEENRIIIYDKIVSKIIDNYKYYQNYNSTKAKIKTYLYTDIILCSISTFREEKMEFRYLELTRKSFESFVESYGIECSMLSCNLIPETNIFFSKDEVIVWLRNIIDEKSFDNYKDKIFSYTKNKEGYKYMTESLNKKLDSKAMLRYSNEIDVEYISQNSRKNFLKNLLTIESNPIYRFVLKTYLGININYLNNEIDVIFENSVNLSLIKEIHNLILLAGLENKNKFYEQVFIFLKNNLDTNKNVKQSSIQRRINKDLKKIKKYYKIDLFSDLLLWFTKNLDENLFDKPPIFLKIEEPRFLDLFYSNKFISNLKIIDLSNNKFSELPKEIFLVKDLIEIDLSKNKFEKFPKNIIKLKNLKTINFKDQVYGKKVIRSKKVANFDNGINMDYFYEQLKDCRITF